MSFPLPSLAQDDRELLLERITAPSKEVEQYRLSDMVAPLGEDADAWVAERRSIASRLAQRELTDMLETWADSDSVLGVVEQLRHTDFSLTPRSPSLTGEGGGSATRNGFAVRLRLSETVRLRVSNGSLSRDIYYDVVGQHAWMELYGAELRDGRTGLSLTNEYLGDEDVARVLFTIRHRLQ